MNQSELADALGELADLMFSRAVDMRQVWIDGGDESLVDHSEELEGAATMMTGWAQGLREAE